MSYKLVEWDESLDLTDFYNEASRRGYENNSSQKRMVDCFRNEREWCVWILYHNDIAVGSVAAHSFDDVIPGGYRICARTCAFSEYKPNQGLLTVKRMIREHQHVTPQFFMPKCIEWVNNRGDMYITSNNSTVASQRLVHNLYFPYMEKYGTVSKVKDVFYRGTEQTVWKFNTEVFLDQLNNCERWA